MYLRALGLTDELAHSSIRFSVGRYTTEKDVDDAITLVREKVQKLRDLSPYGICLKMGLIKYGRVGSTLNNLDL